MKIARFNPDNVIRGLLDGEDYVNRVAGSCIYRCPKCGYQLRLRWRNFYKADQRSFLPHGIRPQFDALTPDASPDEQAFLDFHCQKCHAPTRIIFSVQDYTTLSFHFDITLVLVGERE